MQPAKATSSAASYFLPAGQSRASAALRASIGVQNEAVQSMHRATVEADARGRAAQALAAANGRRYDAAQAKLAVARATTCDEAMPFVDQLLKDVK